MSKIKTTTLQSGDMGSMAMVKVCSAMLSAMDTTYETYGQLS